MTRENAGPGQRTVYGPAFDVTREGEELSLKVLESTLPETAYSYDPKEEYPNRVLLRWHC